MTDSFILYNEALNLQNMNRYSYSKVDLKNSYIQIVSTMFYELVAKKNSPLLSSMCLKNKINLIVENFQIDLKTPRLLSNVSSADMYYILYGLNTIFSEDLNTCEQVYESRKQYIFVGCPIGEKNFVDLIDNLKHLDEHLKKFSIKEISAPKPQIVTVADEEEKILLKSLNAIAKSRRSDDEKIINSIKGVQNSLQDEIKIIQENLKTISKIRDDIDFRTMKESINQLIHLYYRLDTNLKKHPQEDISKGYNELIKRCNRFLDYIVQALEAIGVEIINNVGETFNPDKNKVADDRKFSLNSKVTKVNKLGFIYKEQVIEKAEVEVENKIQNFNKTVLGGISNENRN